MIDLRKYNLGSIDVKDATKNLFFRGEIFKLGRIFEDPPRIGVDLIDPCRDYTIVADEDGHVAKLLLQKEKLLQHSREGRVHVKINKRNEGKIASFFFKKTGRRSIDWRLFRACDFPKKVYTWNGRPHFYISKKNIEKKDMERNPMDTFLTFFKNTHSSAIGNLDDESEPESIDEEALTITPTTKDNEGCADASTKEVTKKLELSKPQKQKMAKEIMPANDSTPPLKSPAKRKSTSAPKSQSAANSKKDTENTAVAKDSAPAKPKQAPKRPTKPRAPAKPKQTDEKKPNEAGNNPLSITENIVEPNADANADANAENSKPKAQPKKKATKPKTTNNISSFLAKEDLETALEDPEPDRTENQENVALNVDKKRKPPTSARPPSKKAKTTTNQVTEQDAPTIVDFSSNHEFVFKGEHRMKVWNAFTKNLEICNPDADAIDKIGKSFEKIAEKGLEDAEASGDFKAEDIKAISRFFYYIFAKRSVTQARRAFI